MTSTRKAKLLRADEIAAASVSFSHPWNPDSQLIGLQLARVSGLERVGINFARMPPGKESFVYHLHHTEEEWIYILQGRAELEIDGDKHVLGAGDFVAFPTPSVAHHMRNPFDVECVYLMGGENRPVEIADFPRHNRRMVRVGDQVMTHELSDSQPMFPPGEG
jgi:uncharacterized cupin superfamily protein